MYEYIFHAFVSVILIFPMFARAQTVSFAATEFPPYVIQEPGYLSGFDVELVQELCRRIDVDPEISVLPWNRALEYVKSGRVDGLLMPVFNEERAQYMYFTDQPIAHEKISIMSSRGENISASSIESLKNERIGVVFGYSYGKAFDENSTLQKDVSYDSGTMLKKLIQGRYRLVVSDEYVINYVARRSGQPELEVVLNLIDNPKFLGFSKAKGQRGKDLAKRFSQAIRDIQQDGTLEKIKKKYFFD